jgi:hypothetical protein
MSPLRRHALSVALGGGLLVLMLLILSLDDLIEPGAPPALETTEVKLYEPPPPPPPPAETVRGFSDARPAFMNTNTETPLELLAMELDVKMNRGGLGELGTGDFGDAFGVDYGIVDIASLDKLPDVLSYPLHETPKEIVEQGIEFVDVRLHIVIDKDGRPYLISVLESSYPGYNKYLRDYVSKVRFTPPTLLGTPVRTEFIWPVRLEMQ